MREEELAELSHALRRRREELVGVIAGAGRRSGTVELDQPIGRLSRMDALQQQSMASAQQRMASAELEAVEHALERVAHDRYGDCVACGEEIALGRLRARPMVPFCLPCQRERER